MDDLLAPVRQFLQCETLFTVPCLKETSLLGFQGFKSCCNSPKQSVDNLDTTVVEEHLVSFPIVE